MKSLLEAVLAGDLDSRLILADWYDDHDDSETARVLRRSIQGTDNYFHKLPKLPFVRQMQAYWNRVALSTCPEQRVDSDDICDLAKKIYVANGIQPPQMFFYVKNPQQVVRRAAEIEVARAGAESNALVWKTRWVGETRSGRLDFRWNTRNEDVKKQIGDEFLRHLRMSSLFPTGRLVGWIYGLYRYLAATKKDRLPRDTTTRIV